MEGGGIAILHSGECVTAKVVGSKMTHKLTSPKKEENYGVNKLTGYEYIVKEVNTQ